MTVTDASLAADPSPHPEIVWGEVLPRHDRWLRTVVAARVGEPQAVDEVMQEVAVAAIEQKSPLADASKVGAWLYRLAVRRALIHRRTCGRRSRRLDRYARIRPIDGEQPSPLVRLLSDERNVLVRRALERLSSRDAEILLLKYSEDWSYREMAERLGTTESAVESRLHRARTRLRAEWDRLNAKEYEP